MWYNLCLCVSPMADDQPATADAMDETQATEQPTKAPAKAAGGSGKRMPLAALGGGLALGATLGLFVMGPALAGSASPAKVESGADEAAAGKSGSHEGGNAEGSAAANSIYGIDNVVLNPAGSGGTRFLLLAVAVDMATSAAVEELKARDAEARDVLLRVVGSKTVEELTSLDTRDALRRQLVDSLGALLPTKNSVRRVFFPQFVVQ